MFRRPIAVFFLTLASLLSGVSLKAQTTSLNFDSLPSSQGWTYVATNSTVSETSIFSVSNSTLHQNTLGLGGFQADYERFNFGDPLKPFVLSMRSRTLQEDSSATYGFGFGWNTGTKYYSVSVGVNAFRFGSGSNQSASVDTTLFHDYRIEGNPNGLFNFYVDNLLYTTSSAVGQSGSNSIYFGDLTPTGSNARADITQFSFRNVSTPAPSALFTALFGLVPGAGLLWRRWKSEK